MLSNMRVAVGCWSACVGTHRGWAYTFSTQGPGIASDRLETIFEPYRRFDDRTRGADSGYGLGLALVKLQADLMTFEVDVHSKVGRGTRVCVSMPKAFQ
jgi:signal transduction histidine kinase